MQILDHGIQVEAVEFLGVIESLSHRIGSRGALVENVKVQLVRPPAEVRARAGSARERALAFACHGLSDRSLSDPASVAHRLTAPRPTRSSSPKPEPGSTSE